MCQYCLESAALDLWFENQNHSIYSPDADILFAELATEITDVGSLLTHQSKVPAPLLCWRLGQAENDAILTSLKASDFCELSQLFISISVNWLPHFPALFNMLSEHLASGTPIDWDNLYPAIVVEAEQLLGLLLLGLNNDPQEQKLSFRQDWMYYFADQTLITELENQYSSWARLFDDNAYYILMATEVIMRERPYSHVLSDVIFSLLPCDAGYALGWQRHLAKHVYTTYNRHYIQQNMGNMRSVLLVYLCFTFKHDHELIQSALSHFQEFEWFDSEYISRESAIEFVQKLQQA